MTFTICDNSKTASFFIEESLANLAIHKFGHNTDIDTASTPETIWGGGGDYTGQNTSVATTIDVISDSTDDDGGGIGALTVLVQGLDANYDRIEETITMNGTSAVTSSGSFLRAFRVIVKTAGSSGHNVGEITIYENGASANVFAVMPVTTNQTLICAYTIPNGFTGCLVGWTASITGTGSSRDGDLSILVRPEGEVFQTKTLTTVYDTSFFFENLVTPICLLSKSDIKIQCTRVSSNNTGMRATMSIVLIAN
jgi:hypothetical protein